MKVCTNTKEDIFIPVSATTTFETQEVIDAFALLSNYAPVDNSIDPILGYYDQNLCELIASALHLLGGSTPRYSRESTNI